MWQAVLSCLYRLISRIAMKGKAEEHHDSHGTEVYYTHGPFHYEHDDSFYSHASIHIGRDILFGVSNYDDEPLVLNLPSWMYKRRRRAMDDVPAFFEDARDLPF